MAKIRSGRRAVVAHLPFSNQKKLKMAYYPKNIMHENSSKRKEELEMYDDKKYNKIVHNAKIDFH